MNRMNTKAKRLEWREQTIKAARTSGATVTEHADADCISIIKHCAERRHEITVYDGTAYKPAINVWTTTAERAQELLDRHLQQRREHIARVTDERGSRKLSGEAQTAAAIREMLARRFPGVKFSVRCSSFSMGNDVSISWTDGPATELVDFYAKRYAYGRYDPMEDYAYTVDIDPALGCPGAKYVSASRHISAARRAVIEAAARAETGGGLPDHHGGILPECSENYFNAERYEFQHPELWSDEYRRMYDEQRAERAQEQAEAEAIAEQERQDEREAEVFRAKAREHRQSEALSAVLDAVLGVEREPKQPADVVNLAEYRQRRDGYTLAEFADKYCKQ
ncbi:MAG: hypothetical protein PHI27_06380 [Eubacteriales bacterium]|nr:hypothetical protein [Eubacteriales bacterium]MDD3881861.1 hypothetical protein [Eubacteriales bacterium]MDD4512894.1 hypothetical protein [Eubacteriales bacterium]